MKKIEKKKLSFEKLTIMEFKKLNSITGGKVLDDPNTGTDTSSKCGVNGNSFSNP